MIELFTDNKDTIALHYLRLKYKSSIIEGDLDLAFMYHFEIMKLKKKKRTKRQ